MVVSPATAQNVSSRACSSSRPVAGSVLGVEAWVASPEPAVGVFTPAGTCQGRLRRHFVIRSRADRCFLTEPVCRQVRQQSGSGEGSGQGISAACPFVLNHRTTTEIYTLALHNA